MTSSISNSKPILKILLCLGAVFLVAEVSMRLLLPTRSQNMRTIQKIRQSSSSLEGDETIILGNSFTLCGIDSDQLQDHLADSEGKAATGDIRVHALSGSQICEWDWIARLHFLDAARPPARIVLNIGPKSTVDNPVIRHRRLALIFKGKRQIIPASDLVASKKNPEFLLSRLSLLLSRGRNVGALILRKLVGKSPPAPPSAGPLNTASPDKSERYTRLLRLAEACQERNVELLLITMPHRAAYALDPKLVDLASLHDIQIVHGPSVAQESLFADKVHLNEMGRASFTPRYGNTLKKAVELSGQPPESDSVKMAE